MRRFSLLGILLAILSAGCQSGNGPAPAAGPAARNTVPSVSPTAPRSEAATTATALPREVVDGGQRVVAIDPVAGGRRLVRTYTTVPYAQNGGTTRFWWLDRAATHAALLISAVEGGGHFLTTAQNGRWFFWNRYADIGPEVWPGMHDAQAGLVDLQTGAARPVALGDPGWTETAWWAPDGRLHFTRDRSGTHAVLDPQTGSVGPE